MTATRDPRDGPFVDDGDAWTVVEMATVTNPYISEGTVVGVGHGGALSHDAAVDQAARWTAVSSATGRAMSRFVAVRLDPDSVTP